MYEFGHGLHYSTFAYDWLGPAPQAGPGCGIGGAESGAGLGAKVRRWLASFGSTGAGVRAAALATTAGDEVARHSVNVTNTGTVAQATSVLAFSVPPGAGTGGAPLKPL